MQVFIRETASLTRSVVSKQQLLAASGRRRVAEDNVKAQVSELRRALAEGREFIRTELGRGCRFTDAVRPAVIWSAR